jgi:hypothetical protein
VVAPAFVLLVTVSLKTIYTAAESWQETLLSKNNSPNYSGRIENPIRSSPPVRRFKFQLFRGPLPALHRLWGAAISLVRPFFSFPRFLSKALKVFTLEKRKRRVMRPQ